MPIERMWSEVNSRVNYPIKRKLISLVNDGCLDMNDETVKFCVSFITCQVVHAGIKRFVSAWNEHTIPSEFHVMYESIKFMYIIIKNDRIIELWKFRQGKLGMKPFMKPCKILVDSQNLK